MPNHDSTGSITDVLAEAAKRAAADEVSPLEWKARLAEWLEELNWLFATLEQWVSPATSAGHASWSARPDAVIREDFLGEYKAPSYELLVGRRSLIFRPVATLVVGSRGRVDVVSGVRSAMLVLLDGEHEWKIATRTPRLETSALTEDTFASLLSGFLKD
jgi:hypothetical protein